MEKINETDHCKACKGPIRDTVPYFLSKEGFCSGLCRSAIIYKNTSTGRLFSGSTRPHTKDNRDDRKT